MVDGPGFFSRVDALLANLETATTTNLNVSRINGPNDRVDVNANLYLNGNVHLDDTTSFIGVIRTGGLNVASDAAVQGDLVARNVEANASIVAGGNVVSDGGLSARAVVASSLVTGRFLMAVVLCSRVQPTHVLRARLWWGQRTRALPDVLTLSVKQARYSVV